MKPSRSTGCPARMCAAYTIMAEYWHQEYRDMIAVNWKAFKLIKKWWHDTGDADGDRIPMHACSLAAAELMVLARQPRRIS